MQGKKNVDIDIDFLKVNHASLFQYPYLIFKDIGAFQYSSRNKNLLLIGNICCANTHVLKISEESWTALALDTTIRKNDLYDHTTDKTGNIQL